MRFEPEPKIIMLEKEEEETTSLPRKKKTKKKARIDLDLETAVAAWSDPQATSLMVTVARLGAIDARVLFDTGAAVNIVSGKFVLDHKLTTESLEHGPLFRTADGRKHRCEKVLKRTAIRIGPYEDVLTNVHVIPGDCPFDLILGKPWHDTTNPKIDFPNNILEITHNGEYMRINANHHDEKIKRESGLISAVEMLQEITNGSTAHISVLKPYKPENQTDDEFYESYVEDIVKEYQKVFETPDKPVEAGVYHEIELEPGANPVATAMYRLSYEELAELKAQLLDLLKKGFIRPSKSPFGAPILFVKKKNGSMRMCVDYRQLNRVTKKNACPLPRIEDLLDKLSGAKYFTSLDMTGAYHQIKIKPEDIEKTAFRTPYGHFEFIVLPFGLCNAPATFQTFMNTLFREEIDSFVLVYLDDIMIFSKTLEQHIKHVRHVLQKMQSKGLKLNLAKCSFFKTKIEWLGYIISAEGIEVDKKKIQAILDWPVPKNTLQILAYLGFTGWYRKFIEKYSHIAAPMTDLLKKDVPFVWTEKQQAAFEKLKTLLTTTPILALPSPDYPFHMYTDASDFAMGGVLMQDQGQGLRPVAFSSKKLSAAEQRYDIYEKEAMSQIYHLKQWRCYLQGAPRSTCYTDNAVLKHLQTQAKLTSKQARWMLVLQEYNVYVDYITGRANVVADALSRRADHAVSVVYIQQNSDWLQALKESYEKDKKTVQIIESIHNGTARDYAFDHGYLVRRTATKTQLYIPDTGTLRQDLLEEHHDTLLGGHFGAAKTATALLRHYYWPNAHADVREYVDSCLECKSSKSSNLKQPGLLRSLPIPHRRFEVITMDFISGLPATADGYTDIMVMVDKLTKRVFLAATKSTPDAEEAATLFYNHVIRNQGVPQVIISDRGTQFTSNFWQKMVEQLGTKHKLSTAYHPQTDGQSENMVRTVSDTLRTLNKNYQNWAAILPAVEFAINSSKNTSTGFSPFYLCYGEEAPVPAALDFEKLARNNTNQASVDFAVRTQLAIEQAKRCLQQAQAKQKKYADQHRRHIEFEAGQQVLISTKDLPLSGPRRLAPKWYGPVTIIRKLSALNYQVALPEEWKRKHPVFHIEKLRLYESSAKFPGRMNTRPPPDLEQGSDVYNVESILGRRVIPRGRGFKIEYLIKWEGYPLHEATWEPKSNLRDAGTSVQQMVKEIDENHKQQTASITTNNTDTSAQDLVPEPSEPGPPKYFSSKN